MNTRIPCQFDDTNISVSPRLLAFAIRAKTRSESQARMELATAKRSPAQSVASL